jgi:hypothetical protein
MAKVKKLRVSKRMEHASRSQELDDEPSKWSSQSANAQLALDFWVGFLDLRMGDTDQPLDSSARARLLTIIRAVSWVESQHGTAGSAGNQPARDPMQCGNPNDAWWKELIDPTGQTDRFVGGPNAQNYWAGELPDAAASGPNFPAQAKLSVLTDETAGHADANFSAILSYCWAAPILVQKTNTGAGDKTYECRDLSQQRLVDGAVAYNGGGDPDYRQKITDALAAIGWPTLVTTSEESDVSRVTEIAKTLQNLLQQTVKTIAPITESASDGGTRLFFPNGIELIDIHVKVATIDVELKIAGPKASA